MNYQPSNEALLKRYHDRESTPALKQYLLKTLTGRANLGNKEAKSIVAKIGAVNKSE